MLDVKRLRSCSGNSCQSNINTYYILAYIAPSLGIAISDLAGSRPGRTWENTFPVPQRYMFPKRPRPLGAGEGAYMVSTEFVAKAS